MSPPDMDRKKRVHGVADELAKYTSNILLQKDEYEGEVEHNICNSGEHTLHHETTHDTMKRRLQVMQRTR